METRVPPFRRRLRARRRLSRRKNTHFADLCDVLVAATADTDEYGIVRAPTTALRREPTDGVRALESGNDPFETTQQLESFQGVVIGNGHVCRAADDRLKVSHHPRVWRWADH